ncbi:MAG: sporulation protein YqfD [Bacilli bacterium]|nr:sporulation protein YqfD [Bacilli bacterium]
MFLNLIDIKVSGRNPEKIIKKLKDKNIDIYNIKYVKYNLIILRIKKEDYNNLDYLKVLYDIEIIEFYGFDKIKYLIKKNIYLLISIFISISVLILLTNTIFDVSVIHNNKSIRDTILRELKNNGIDKYHLKKSYKELDSIKKKILDKHSNEIEWLEIKSVGVKYIVRVEERIIKKGKDDAPIRNIVAKKDAIIRGFDIKSGEIVKNKFDFVRKGDVVVTGDIKLYEESKKRVSADGVIYGEVWYKVTIEYPLKINDITLTGNKKKVYTIRFFNKYFDLSFRHFKNVSRKDKIILKNNIFPIYLAYETQYEIKKLEKTLSKKQAEDEAIKQVKKMINKKLGEKEYIIDVKKLKVHENNSKIVLELFINVCEDITQYSEITE